MSGPVAIKVCGFTRPGQARDAGGLGVGFAGIVLWEPSSRSVMDRGLAIEISRAVLEGGALPVGVFVDEDPDTVLDLAEQLNLSRVQLHGSETPSQVTLLSEAGLNVWKGLQVGPGFEPELARAHWAAGAEAVLLDAWHPKLPGGTGQTTDWSIAAKLAREGAVVVAGGLGPDNVADAVEAIVPWGVDGSSALEHNPGFKDMDRVAGFVSAARGVSEATP